MFGKRREPAPTINFGTDTGKLRPLYAAEIGVTEETVKRMRLATAYVASRPYILVNAAAKQLAAKNYYGPRKEKSRRAATGTTAQARGRTNEKEMGRR